jgi:hypothetical protein
LPFSANEQGSTFGYSFDGVSFASRASPQEYSEAPPRLGVNTHLEDLCDPPLLYIVLVASTAPLINDPAFW